MPRKNRIKSRSEEELEDEIYFTLQKKLNIKCMYIIKKIKKNRL